MRFNKRILSIALLGAIITALLWGPVVYQFSFPSAGDDGARYLINLANGEAIHNYGIYLVKPLEAIGLSPVQSLSFLYYMIIAVSVLMVWLITRRYSFINAVVATPLIFFANWGLWRLWFDGSVLGIGGLLIFNLGAIFCLSKLEESKKRIWLIPFVALLVAGFLFHKTSGVYLLLTAVVYAIFFKNYAVFIITVLMASFGLFLWGRSPDVVSNTLTTQSPLNYALLALITGFAGYLVYHFRKHIEPLPVTTKLLSILFGVMLVSSVLKNPYQYRLLFDMTTIGMLIAIPFMSKLITLLPFPKYQLITVGLILAFCFANLSERWTTNYSAVSKDDEAIFASINQVANKYGHITVASTWGESPWLMRVYLNSNVELTTDLSTADVVLYRHLNKLYNEQHGAISDISTQIALNPEYQLRDYAIYKRR